MTTPPSYEICVTAVSERADLFAESMESLLAHVDLPPARLIVHEDVRPGSEPGEIGRWLAWAKGDGRIADYAHRVTSPARGMGPGIHWAFAEARTPIVLYAQEDWLSLRAFPIRRALELMEAHGLNHIRFNKRKTMRAKHEDRPTERWAKVEVQIDGQTLCVSDHFYTQASLWRVAPALRGMNAVAERDPGAYQFVHAFNGWMDTHLGDGRPWNDQQHRHERIRTYIWGPIGEPAFIKHLGSVRTTGPVDHLAKSAQT